MAAVQWFLCLMARAPTGVIARIRLLLARSLSLHQVSSAECYQPALQLPDFFTARVLHTATARTSPIEALGP